MLRLGLLAGCIVGSAVMACPFRINLGVQITAPAAGQAVGCKFTAEGFYRAPRAPEISVSKRGNILGETLIDWQRCGIDYSGRWCADINLCSKHDNGNGTLRDMDRIVVHVRVPTAEGGYWYDQVTLIFDAERCLGQCDVDREQIVHSAEPPRAVAKR